MEPTWRLRRARMAARNRVSEPINPHEYGFSEVCNTGPLVKDFTRHMELTWRNIWFESKALLKHQLGLSTDLMHVHLGLGLFLVCAVVLRTRRNGMLLAWIIVVGLQTFNELLDARDWINWTGSVNWSEAAKDFGATLFWPTVLLLSWRWVGPAR